MIILGLDLAASCGYAYGVAGKRPYSGAWDLRRAGADKHQWAGELFCCMDRIADEFGIPDIVAVEEYMSPSSRKGDHNAVISQLLLHGSVFAWTRKNKVRHVRESVGTIRKHLCGQAHAAIVIPEKTGKEKAKRMKSLATKIMVADRLGELGLAPVGCRDLDRTDGIAVHAWASSVVCGAALRFVLTP